MIWIQLNAIVFPWNGNENIGFSLFMSNQWSQMEKAKMKLFEH